MKVSEVTVEMSGDLKKLGKDLNRGKGTVKSWTSKIGKMFTKLFVVDIARLAQQFIAGIGRMLKKATKLITKFVKEAIGAVDEEVLVVRRLANEIGDLGKAQTIIDGLEESSIKWGIAMSDVWNGFLMGRRLFKEDWITKNLGTIAESSKQLNQPLETMIRNLATVKEGMLSTRKLIEMGLTREMLKAEGIEFEKGLAGLPDKLRSNFEDVVDAIVKIWERKYVKGVGAGIVTIGEKITTLKNLWGQVMESVGRSGLYQHVTGQLQGIIDWMAKNKQIIFDWADFIGKKLTEAFRGASAVGKKLFEEIFEVLESAGEMNSGSGEEGIPGWAKNMIKTIDEVKAAWESGGWEGIGEKIGVDLGNAMDTVGNKLVLFLTSGNSISRFTDAAMAVAKGVERGLQNKNPALAAGAGLITGSSWKEFYEAVFVRPVITLDFKANKDAGKKMGEEIGDGIVEGLKGKQGEMYDAITGE